MTLVPYLYCLTPRTQAKFNKIILYSHSFNEKTCATWFGKRADYTIQLDVAFCAFVVCQKHSDRKFLTFELVSKNEISLCLTHTVSNERLRTLSSRSV